MALLERQIKRTLRWFTAHKATRFFALALLFLILVFALVGAWSIFERFFPALSTTPALVSVHETPSTSSTLPESATNTAPEAAGEVSSQSAVRRAGERTTETYRIPLGSVSTGGDVATNRPGLPAGETRTDLRVNVLAVGIIDPAFSRIENFKEVATATKSDQIAIRFAVENIGASESGPWEYYAFLPVQFGGGSDGHIYRSGQQTSLLPGDRKVYTLTTTRLKFGNQSIEVLIDPGNRLNEITRTNNRDSGTIRIPLN